MVGLVTGTPSNAVVGDAVKDGSYAFTAKLDIGGQRSCSAALVEPQWLITAASCFADNPSQSLEVPAGAPKLKTTAIIGRTDLTRDSGAVADVVELVPRTDRDLVMARLDRPVSGISLATPATSAPLPGQEVRVTGYGRTKSEWVPDRLHSGSFTVGSVQSTHIGLASKSPEAAVCQGDTGGPAFRDVGGRVELVGVNSMSWQGGCLGADESETRKDAVDTRVDDIAGWAQAVSSRTLLSRANWKNATQMASGYFTSPPGTKRRMDLFVVWNDASASIFQGADHDDPRYPYSAEHKVAPAGSYWKYARAVAGGSFTGSGTDGLTVRWDNGKLSTYTHIDLNGFHDEKVLGADGSYWKNARLIAVGRYSDNALRDDMFVLWDDGQYSLYFDLGNGIGKRSHLERGWTAAAQVSSGEFGGGKTAGLLIRWNDGSATVLSGLDATGYHGRTSIRPPGSAWGYVRNLTVGSFSGDVSRPGDVLIRWSSGALSYYPDVTPQGTTHGEVQLVD